MLFVLQGAVKLISHVGLDREQILSFHFSGDAICPSAGGAHQLEIVAITDSEIVSAAWPEFSNTTQVDGAALSLLLERTTRSLQRCRDKAVALGRKSAPERVADFLLTMAERIGLRDQDGALITLPMSRRDIADSLGLTIETVSRQLGELRSARIIETRGRSQVWLLDLAALYARTGRSKPHAQINSRI